MKFISWNVNGLRACMQKGFLDFFKQIDADIFCLQETKLQEGQIDLDLPGYHQYWNYAEKKGYSGTAIFTKEEPLMTILLLGPLNFILDKIWKKPEEPMTLIVEPEGKNVKIRKAQTGREENPKNRKMATETESYPLTQLFAFLNPEDNTICYQKKWYIIGENTIENIYPAKYRHPWMDHPENKASAITDVQRLTDILKGYEASLEAARKEQEWLNNQK